MLQSEQIDQLAKALAVAQGEMKAPPKDKTAKVPTKSGGSYSYSYSDLATMIDCNRAVLAKNGLSISQTMDVEGDCLVLVTTLMHASGQWKSGRCPLPKDRTPQELGSAITYMRRYSLGAILGIASDEDDDGDSASHKPQPSQAQAPKPQSNQGVAPPKNPLKEVKSGAFCEACNTELQLSKSGAGYFCPNFQAEGEHSRFPVARLEEFKQKQSAFDAQEDIQF